MNEMKNTWKELEKYNPNEKQKKSIHETKTIYFSKGWRNVKQRRKKDIKGKSLNK